MSRDHIIGSALVNLVTSSTGVTLFAMTDAVSIAIVGGLVTLITGVATIYFAYKAKVISAEGKEISAEAKEISKETGKAVNGKMEEFKRMAEEFYHAKGVADEKLAAEAKAGVQAAAKAEGKAEGKAEVSKPSSGQAK